jgi:hypothetical protein
VAFVLPVLVGVAGLGTEAGYWYLDHRWMQSAADSAAYSGATSRTSGDTLFAEATAITAKYDFVSGSGGVIVTVNRPPATGSHASNVSAVEVIVERPLDRLVSAMFGSGKVTIRARAVAIPGGDGLGCVLALNSSASDTGTVIGSAVVNLKGCSLYDNSSDPSALTVGGSAKLSAYSVNVVGGISGKANITTSGGNVVTGAAPTDDPYKGVDPGTPTGPARSCCKKNQDALEPGIYKDGMKLTNNENITLKPGIYYLQGDLELSGGASLTGTGVTLVFTRNSSGKYAGATINGGTNFNLTAPTSGPTAGIAMYGDPSMPLGEKTFKLNGGSNQTIKGAIYFPKGNVEFEGGSNTTKGCTQIVADKIKFSGNPNLQIDCTGVGTKPIGNAVTKLVE